MLATAQIVTPTPSAATGEGRGDNIGARLVGSYPTRKMLGTDLGAYRNLGHASILFNEVEHRDHEDDLHSISLRYLGCIQARH